MIVKKTIMGVTDIYKEKAKYYDLIYSWKNYEKEADELLGLMAKYNIKNGSLLDIACGTGKHIMHFQKKFDCTGTDVNNGILKIAKKNVPTAKFHHASLQRLKLKQKFDAVLNRINGTVVSL